jgi:hypothetical protein
MTPPPLMTQLGHPASNEGGLHRRGELGTVQREGRGRDAG